MPFNIQAAINANPGTDIVIPNGLYTVSTSITLPSGTSIRGESLSGTILEGNVTSGDIVTAIYSGYSRGHNVVENLTMRSLQGNVGGVHFVNNGGCSVRNVLFQGLVRNIHIDRGLGYSIQGCKNETFGTNLGGSILVEASDNIHYAQHISVEDYQSYFGTTSAGIILSRATNIVMNNILMHQPNNVGIMVNNDSQGIQIANTSIVGCTDGVQIYAQGGHAPLGVEFNSINVDQASGLGLWVGNGTNIRMRGGLLTDCYQGVEISTYASCNTVFLDQVHIFQMQANGIVMDGGASYFYITNCVIGGNTAGAAIVISGGNSDHYIVANNDVSQNNASGFVNFSTGGTHKIVTPNIT